MPGTGRANLVSPSSEPNQKCLKILLLTSKCLITFALLTGPLSGCLSLPLCGFTFPRTPNREIGFNACSVTPNAFHSLRYIGINVSFRILVLACTSLFFIIYSSYCQLRYMGCNVFVIWMRFALLRMREKRSGRVVRFCQQLSIFWVAGPVLIPSFYRVAITNGKLIRCFIF